MWDVTIPAERHSVGPPTFQTFTLAVLSSPHTFLQVIVKGFLKFEAILRTRTFILVTGIHFFKHSPPSFLGLVIFFRTRSVAGSVLYIERA